MSKSTNDKNPNFNLNNTEQHQAPPEYPNTPEPTWNQTATKQSIMFFANRELIPRKLAEWLIKKLGLKHA